MASQTPDEPARAAAPSSMWQCGEYQWKVIPRAHVEDSWKSIRRWDPQAEAKVAHEFETVKNCAFFASHLYKDDKLRSIALAQTCSYLSAWRCHVEDDTPFTDQPWISQFKRNSEQETMQEKLDSVCDWHHYDRTNLMAEMKDAVKFLDVLCVNTRDGPHAPVFQGALSTWTIASQEGGKCSRFATNYEVLKQARNRRENGSCISDGVYHASLLVGQLAGRHCNSSS
eukprot:s296_g33.t1